MKFGETYQKQLAACNSCLFVYSQLVNMVKNLGNAGANPIQLKAISRDILLIVYDQRDQNLKFVAPMPEQSGTITMPFTEGAGGPE